MARTELKANPSAEILTLADAKRWLKVTFNENDELIGSLIPVARRAVELLTGRAIGSQQYYHFRDCFPGRATIELEKPPLITVDTVEYIDPTTGTWATLSSAAYSTSKSSPARIRLNEGYSWPTTKKVLDAVRITYTVGYLTQVGVSAGSINEGHLPDELLTAMKLMLAHIYSNPQPYTSGSMFKVDEVPLTIHLLTGPYRVFT